MSTVLADNRQQGQGIQDKFFKDIVSLSITGNQVYPFIPLQQFLTIEEKVINLIPFKADLESGQPPDKQLTVTHDMQLTVCSRQLTVLNR